MRTVMMVVGLLVAASRRGLSQALTPADTAEIERVAAAYVAPTLGGGVIGFDGLAFNVPHDRGGRQRSSSQIAALLTVLNATSVRTDSVLTCGSSPSTCRLSVNALVRVGAPYSSKEGARIVVEQRRRSGSGRQPVSHGTQELMLSKESGGRWVVVGIAAVSVS